MKAKAIFTRKRVLTTALAVALLLTVFLPNQQRYTAADITNTDKNFGVNGRILPASMAGDTSDWIEIARNGDYALIIRKDVLPIGQVAFDARNIDAYQISDVRNRVNTWFKSTLNSNARLRDFTVLPNVLAEIGYFGVITNGFTKPSTTSVRTGDDVAFLLSFAEAAMFCSENYATSSTTVTASPALAKANYNKLSTTPADGAYRAFFWLRSGGNNAGTTKSASSVGTHGIGLVNCVYASSSQAAYPYVRPALWVGLGIFETKGTVNVIHKDADDGSGLGQASHVLNPGSYGPYGPETFPGYGPGVLAPGSDPPSGTIAAGITKTVTYLYTKIPPPVTIIVNHWGTDGMDLWREDYEISAGPYGPYGPLPFFSYGPGRWDSTSDPRSGTAAPGATITIVFLYDPL